MSHRPLSVADFSCNKSRGSVISAYLKNMFLISFWEVGGDCSSEAPPSLGCGSGCGKQRKGHINFPFSCW